MVAVEGAERGRVERLAAEAHAVHATLPHRCHERVRDVKRIGLDGDLGPGRGHEPPAEQVEETSQAGGAEVRRRATADVHRGEFETRSLYTYGRRTRRHQRRRNPLQFPLQRREIAFHEVVAAGHECEVAVAAAVPAERHVDVGVAGESVHGVSHYTASSGSTRPTRHGAAHAPGDGQAP